MKVSAETRSISLSALASLVVILPVVWLLMKPLIASSLAGEIKQTVHTEMRPMNTALIALLQTNVANIRRRIARLEYRRDHPPADDYTERDADELVNLQIELASSVVAMDALRASS